MFVAPPVTKNLSRSDDVNEDKKRWAKSEFIISKYWWDKDIGRFRCKKPKSLPCGRDGRECCVVVHEWRVRTTGPEHRLMVVYCRTHGTYFTIYPPGYVPYGRAPVAPVCSGEDESDAALTAWSGTVFESAVSDGWLHSYTYTGGTSWQTHRRDLQKHGQMFGLSGPFTVCENAAAILDIPLHVQLSARSRYSVSGLDGQLEAVQSVLKSISVSPRLWRRLMRLGRETGAWGEAWEWTDDNRLLPLFPLPERNCLKPRFQAVENDP